MHEWPGDGHKRDKRLTSDAAGDILLSYAELAGKTVKIHAHIANVDLGCCVGYSVLAMPLFPSRTAGGKTHPCPSRAMEQAVGRSIVRCEQSSWVRQRRRHAKMDAVPARLSSATPAIAGTPRAFARNPTFPRDR